MPCSQVNNALGAAAFGQGLGKILEVLQILARGFNGFDDDVEMSAAG